MASRTGFPAARDWDANWIWHRQAPKRNAYVLFRSEFDLADPTAARLFISADTRYRVWINGTLLGDGPPQSQPYHQYYDERALDGAAQPGRNCIAVLVHHQGVQDAARGGLLAEITENGVVAASGEEWLSLVGTAWLGPAHFSGGNRIGPFQEHVDLRRVPTGWQKPGFDASGWQPSQVLDFRGATKVPRVMPWCRVVPRDIEYLVENPVYGVELQTVEECLDLATRRAPGDVSISLSQAGRPLDWATLEDRESLLSLKGETVFACSDRHRDGVTDGRYDPCVTLDFGRVLTGYVEVEVEAPAGAVLEVGYAERLVDGRFNIALECPFGDKVTFREGENTFRPMIWRSFRYLRIRVRDSENGLKVRALRAVEVNYPFEKRGAYQGDDRLEQVFAICRTTLELCSIESLMDTPYREQAQWLGDVAAVTVPGIYACFGDTALPGKFIRQAALNTRPTGLIANISNVASHSWENEIPDYSLWWVIALWQHYLYSGEGRYLHECYPELQRIMRSHLERINADGLLDPMFGWVFIDWAHIDVDGVCAPYNAIFAGACDAAASVAGFKGDTWAETVYREAAQGVRGGFAKTFVAPDGDLVVDAVRDGQPSTMRSEQGNMAAIAFDCLDAETADRIIHTLFEEKSVKVTEAQPFFMVVVLEALRKRGRVDLALQLIDERWGRRMVDRGYTSCTEEWYENGSWRNGQWQGFQRTHSHAWSACAADFLIKGLGGIEILDPGCTRVRVNPYAGPKPYSLVYPLPQGELALGWDGSRTSVSAPDGVEVVR